MGAGAGGEGHVGANNPARAGRRTGRRAEHEVGPRHRGERGVPAVVVGGSVVGVNFGARQPHSPAPSGLLNNAAWTATSSATAPPRPIRTGPPRTEKAAPASPS